MVDAPEEVPTSDPADTSNAGAPVADAGEGEAGEATNAAATVAEEGGPEGEAPPGGSGGETGAEEGEGEGGGEGEGEGATAADGDVGDDGGGEKGEPSDLGAEDSHLSDVGDADIAATNIPPKEERAPAIDLRATLDSTKADPILASLFDDSLYEELAGKIEGFEDDFLESEPEEEENLVMEEMEDLEAFDIELDEQILGAKKRWDRGMTLHRILEARIGAHLLAVRGSMPATVDETILAQKFHAQLASWQAMKEEMAATAGKYERQLQEIKITVASKRAKAAEIGKTFRDFVLEVARGSDMSNTGTPMSMREVHLALKKIAEKENMLQGIRLRSVQLRRRYERALEEQRSKEQLAEGLHLIDFEQLKIENQSLNEKIEERNEELSKLSRKAMAAVLVLTHVKEKLQFVEKDNARLEAILVKLDGALAKKRDELHGLKLHRDQGRNRVQKMKEQRNTVTDATLVEDLRQQKLRRAELMSRIEQMKRDDRELAEEVATLRAQRPRMSTVTSR